MESNLLKKISSLQKMMELPLEKYTEHQLVCCDCKLNQSHSHACSDSISEPGSDNSYSESCKSFGEAKQRPDFRVKCPIMSRILSTAMAVIDRTSSKSAIRYSSASSGHLSLNSEQTCSESCFDEESEISNGSSFYSYMEKNFSTPRTRRENTLCWPPAVANKDLYPKSSRDSEDEELFSIVPREKFDLGQIKLYSRSYSEALQIIQDELLSESCDSKYDEMSLFSESDEKASDSLDSSYIMELAQSEVPGRPLLQIIPMSETQKDHEMQQNEPIDLQLVPVINPLSWRLFSLDELNCATNEFSEDNLIGRGGCSKVYKGCLSDGKLVAVKVLKQTKNASKEFSSEIDIISALNHKHITPFLGACFEDHQHISVYDFMPGGSLDEHLHGSDMKSVLTWESRYNIAVVIAEALNYLHNECPRPVIHRDVKSSNILLSSDFQPQLSDFGLAIWGPTDEKEYASDTHQYNNKNTLSDTKLVGTFGYIAPEYFMHGKVCDKVDVYSFGVVLLELITGRKPILDAGDLSGQQSLVKWAKPMIDSGDISALADSKLAANFATDQMQRMVSAAVLCTCQSPRARPTMTEVLRLLKGQADARELAESQATHIRNWSEDDDDYWIPPEQDRPRLSLSLALMDTDDESVVINRSKLKRRTTMADYLERSH